MNMRLAIAPVVLGMVVASGCATTGPAPQTQAEATSESPARNPSDNAQGVQVTAAQDQLFVADHPIGDTGPGHLDEGRTVTATCFVGHATTNIGANGSAVQIEFDDAPGYVAVAIVDFEDGETIRFLEQTEE